MGDPLAGVIRWLASQSGLLVPVGLAIVVCLGLSVVREARNHGRIDRALASQSRTAVVAGEEVEIIRGNRLACVAGLRHPRIYLGSNLVRELPAAQLRAIVLHERHHQLHRAPVRLALLAALEPALRHVPSGQNWLARRRAEIEIAADQHALNRGVALADIARALLRLGSEGGLALVPGYASQTDIRLRALLDGVPPDEPRWSAGPARTIARAALLACPSVVAVQVLVTAMLTH